MKTHTTLMFLRFPRVLMALAAALLVSACGGGGGGGGTPTTTSPTTSVVPATTTSATPASSATEELAAFNLLNAERTRCGFGAMARNSQLDAAAKAHADYQIRNNLLTHDEDAVQYPTGFTGATPAARVAAAGYLSAGGVTDEIAAFFGGTASKTGLGEAGVRGLLGAPYHLRGLMAGYRDVGVSVRASTDWGTSQPAVYLQINAAYKADVGPQLLGTGDVATYPCEGSSGISEQLDNETPNPIPGRNLAINPLGAVVYVSLREGRTLIISSSAMTEVSTSRAITLRPPITSANDPYSPCTDGCYKKHEAYIAADAPLKTNTAYRMQISGSNNGTPFSRTFTFTTGD